MCYFDTIQGGFSLSNLLWLCWPYFPINKKVPNKTPNSGCNDNGDFQNDNQNRHGEFRWVIIDPQTVPINNRIRSGAKGLRKNDKKPKFNEKRHQ